MKKANEGMHPLHQFADKTLIYFQLCWSKIFNNRPEFQSRKK